MTSQALRCWLLVAALFIGIAAPVHGQTGLRNLRNPHFETVGLDLRSVNYINELSTLVVEISQRYLDREGLVYPLPILINLRPKEHFDFEGDHLISFGPRGSVQLDLRWEDGLTLERTCFLLTEALLVQYAVFNNGPSSEVNIPIWPIAGLSSEVYFRLRPSVFIERVAYAKVEPLPSVAQLFKAESDNMLGAKYGFWVLQALKDSSIDRKVVRRLFQLSLSGTDISEALSSVIQPQAPTEEALTLEAWWEAQMQDLLDAEYEMVESMDTTRQWLEVLADFSRPVILGEG